MTYASAADDGLIALQQVQRPPRHPPSTLDARQTQRSTEEKLKPSLNYIHIARTAHPSHVLVALPWCLAYSPALIVATLQIFRKK